MLNKSSHIIYEKNKYKDDKIDLFYDYNNPNDIGNLKNENNNKYFYSDNKFYSPIQNNYNNYSINNNYFNSYTENNNDKLKDREKDSEIDINIDIDKDKEKEDIYKDLNLSFKSNTLKEYIQTKKESFDKLSSSINNIIKKYNDEEESSNKICKNGNKKKNGINAINDNNLNKIVEHLIKAYSKDELKLIKDKLDNEVDEEEEPQPEKLNFIQHFNKKNKLKLSSDSPSFLKGNNNKNPKINLGNKNSNDKNKNKYFKKINKCIIYKPIKISNTNISNTKNIKKNDNINKYFSYESKANNKSNNIKTKPEFYTYIQCKTSFDCLDNFLKRQKRYRSYTENKKNDLRINKNLIENKKHTFSPNTSYTSNSKYSIKLQAQRLNESNASKINRIIANSAEKNCKNLKLKYSKTFTFTPNINKKNNKIYKKYTSDIKLNKNRFKIDTNKDLTPVKYVNHRFDHVKSIYKNDGGLFKRIKEQNKKKIEKAEKLKIENENKEMEGCTFKPDMSMSKTRSKNTSVSKYLNNRNKNAIHDEDKKNKSFNYIDFYEYKKKHKNSNKKN